MGIVRIVMDGSFPRRNVVFSAMEHGHAACIAEAIAWLSKEALPQAIQQDHRLHTDGHEPKDGFGLAAKQAMEGGEA